MVDRLADAINRAQFAGEAAPKVDASTNPLGVNPMNKVLYEDTQGIRNSTSLSPNMKRAKMNENAFQIIQNNRSLLQDIERHEALLSGMFKRPIKFDKLQLGKTMEQQPQ